MNIIEISNWLKDTIPGIIILGATGSILAGVIIWLASKIMKGMFSIVRFILVKIFGDNLAKFGVFYMRYYYITRSTVFQLFNKNAETSLVVVHQKFLANRNMMAFMAVLFFIFTYALFLFTDTEYAKTAIFFVAVTMLSLNDAIAFSIWTKKIESHFYGAESAIANETYKSKDMVVMETLHSLLEFTKKQKTEQQCKTNS